jgi:hypothetical protein
MYWFLHSMMAIAHLAAGIAFSLEGNAVAALVQVVGSVVWLALTPLHIAAFNNNRVGSRG